MPDNWDDLLRKYLAQAAAYSDDLPPDVPKSSTEDLYTRYKEEMQELEDHERQHDAEEVRQGPTGCIVSVADGIALINLD